MCCTASIFVDCCRFFPSLFLSSGSEDPAVQLAGCWGQFLCLASQTNAVALRPVYDAQHNFLHLLCGPQRD